MQVGPLRVRDEVSSDEFDEETLLAEAREAAAGLFDFGCDEFRDGLRALCQTYRKAPLTPAGARRCRRRLVELLATRLRVQAALRRHPEIRERRIVRPMVLTGLPRSGTSALFNLLACDPASRPLLYWEAFHPDPCEGLAPGKTDPRRRAIAKMLERHRAKNPDFDSIHYTGADTPEECVLLQASAFHGVQTGVEVLLEPYASFFLERSPKALYVYQSDLIRMLDWQRPGERWLLKSPAHLWGLDELVAVFPDVSIVWSHRDPVAAIASAASITGALTTTMAEIDPKVLGPRVLEFYARSLERGLASRARLDGGRFLDVDHDAFVGGPIGQAETIYRYFGLAFSDRLRAAMQAHVDAHPRGLHGRHEYDLSRFGLDEERVRFRFLDIQSRLRTLRQASAS